MLYHWLFPLAEKISLFNVVQYLTVRTFMALFTSLVIVLLFGGFWIRFLARRQFLQTLWDYVPETHHTHKQKTPTMGGVLIWLSILISVGLWARWDRPYVWIVLGVGTALAAIGFLDDYLKVIKKDAHGLRARYKFPLQVLVTLLFCLILFDGLGFPTDLSIPFFKTIRPDLGLWYLLFGVFVITGTSNAVNLTDGLDGLVTGPAIICFLTFGLFAYVAGHYEVASYLHLPFIRHSGELAVLCGAVVGALIGFLWYNSHPAEVFMGDVGSLSLGGMLGMTAVITKNEFLLAIVGGVFVLETLSVITQVASFKLTGKRIFRMAPIHHHFELKGWPESKVIVRFWIISIVLALMSLSTLKLR